MPQVFRSSASYARVSAGPALTIGNFDGVHRGHLHLLNAVVERARKDGVPACVFTFSPPPRVVLQPERCPPRIMTLEQRIDRLGEVGIDQVVVEPFDLEYAERSADWFAHEVLARRLAPSSLVVGHDFRFGRRREGRTEDLRRLLPELPVEQVDVMRIDEDRPSSSLIREAVAEGRVADAAVMLGRPYEMRGTVAFGDRRGRELGFPTANLNTTAELLPDNGVYAVQVEVTSGDERGLWPGVANLGMRPTFEGRRYRIEAHLLGYSGDLYGADLSLRFIDFIRSERRFDGPEALAAQIKQDIVRAREILDATG